jgi:hypothetical protein
VFTNQLIEIHGRSAIRQDDVKWWLTGRIIHMSSRREWAAGYHFWALWNTQKRKVRGLTDPGQNERTGRAKGFPIEDKRHVNDCFPTLLPTNTLSISLAFNGRTVSRAQQNNSEWNRGHVILSGYKLTRKRPQDRNITHCLSTQYADSFVGLLKDCKRFKEAIKTSVQKPNFGFEVSPMLSTPHTPSK